MQIWITLILALVCGMILFKIKVPGGIMVGAILGVSTYNIITGNAVFPSEAKFIAQAIAGAFIGSGMDRDDLHRLPSLIKPLFILLVNLLILNLGLGLLISKVSTLDLITSLMSVVPGGMSDTPLIAADMGANAGVVAALQFVRMSVGIGLFPSIIQKIDAKVSQSTSHVLESKDKIEQNKVSSKIQLTRIDSEAIQLIITLLVALLGGLLGNKSGMPAGTLIFSMLSILVLKLGTGIGNLPIKIKRLAQILSGAYVGSGIFAKDIIVLKDLSIPVLLIIICYFINCLLTGFILHRTFKFERKTAFLAATPAGASDMALISSDIGVDSVDLILIQIMRMIIVISVFPQIISLIVSIL